MAYGDIRDDWKLDAIERKAEEATSRLYELDALRRDVDSLERENRQILSTVDELRNELEEQRQAFYDFKEDRCFD